MNTDKQFEICLGITGAFEGASWGGTGGNFDGAGISAFVIQWNLGQKTLQPLILAMQAEDPALFSKCVGDKEAILLATMKGGRASEQTFVTNITTGRPFDKPGNYFSGGAHVVPEWATVFKALGESFHHAQLHAAQPYFDNATKDCRDLFHLTTLRALAFFFDERVQQGGKLTKTHELYHQKLVEFPDINTEALKLDWLLNHAEMETSERYREDVAERRYCIVKGAGIVHGTNFDLGKQFGLTDEIIF
jgi:hypothetical protein